MFAVEMFTSAWSKIKSRKGLWWVFESRGAFFVGQRKHIKKIISHYRHSKSLFMRVFYNTHGTVALLLGRHNTALSKAEAKGGSATVDGTTRNIGL